MKVDLTEDSKLWDIYAETTAPDSLYHRWVWREIIKETFDHQPYYLSAIENGRFQGILPLFSMRSRLFGNFLVSIPFFTYGGIIASKKSASEALLARAAELAREIGASHIELRQGDEHSISWNCNSLKVTMEIPLPATADEYWKKLSSGMRNKIRQGQKHKLRAEWGGREALSIFYKIFAENMRNLGTPVYPERFFDHQIRRLRDRIRILTLWDGKQPVAASFVTAHQQTLELPWSASLPESRKKYSQVLMYWTIIQKAIEDHFSKFDLGRCTRGSGTYEFKRHWNPVERPLYWYYWLAPGASMPQLRPENPKFKLATEIWKRLPLSLANGLGPRVVRSIP